MIKRQANKLVYALLLFSGLVSSGYAARTLVDTSIDYQHEDNINGNKLATSSTVVKVDAIRYLPIDETRRWVNRLGAKIKQQSIDNDANYWELSAASHYAFRLSDMPLSPIVTSTASHRYRHYTNNWYSQSNITKFDIALSLPITETFDLSAGGSHSVNNNVYPEFFGPNWQSTDFHENTIYAGINWQFKPLQIRLEHRYAKGSRFIQQQNNSPIMLWPDTKVNSKQIGLNVPINNVSAIDLQFAQYRASFKRWQYTNNQWALAYLYRFYL